GLVRRLELRLRRTVRWDAVVELDLLLERDLCAVELACRVLETDEMSFQPLATILLEPVERITEPGGVLCERARIAQLLCVDPLLDLGRAVIRVDEPVQVPAETEPELDVLDR